LAFLFAGGGVSAFVPRVASLPGGGGGGLFAAGAASAGGGSSARRGEGVGGGAGAGLGAVFWPTRTSKTSFAGD
jgi:hypothetical protein